MYYPISISSFSLHELALPGFQQCLPIESDFQAFLKTLWHVPKVESASQICQVCFFSFKLYQIRHDRLNLSFLINYCDERPNNLGLTYFFILIFESVWTSSSSRHCRNIQCSHFPVDWSLLEWYCVCHIYKNVSIASCWRETGDCFGHGCVFTCLPVHKILFEPLNKFNLGSQKILLIIYVYQIVWSIQFKVTPTANSP